ncbi:hypothetical protein [Fibrella aestuarina]|uniref:hypothetical protein n=1 Tax=Fibrella aestuarina TaxID=651143 RepID=UPI00059B969C|nr:hypothetical protein [Fibrella aestuarina]
MKRADKQAILQDALKGQSSALRKLQKERLRDSMPYLDAHGVIDVNNCPEALLGVLVYYNDIDNDTITITSQEFICKVADRSGLRRWSMSSSAITMLDPADSQYDLIPLHTMQLTKRNYVRINISGGTIGDLRRYFSRCADSLSKPYIGLFFDAEPREVVTVPLMSIPQ